MCVYSLMDAVCDIHGYISSFTYWSCTDLVLILCGFTRTIYNVLHGPNDRVCVDRINYPSGLLYYDECRYLCNERVSHYTLRLLILREGSPSSKTGSIRFTVNLFTLNTQLVVNDNLHYCKSSLVCRGFALAVYTFDLIKYLKHF